LKKAIITGLHFTQDCKTESAHWLRRVNLQWFFYFIYTGSIYQLWDVRWFLWE